MPKQEQQKKKQPESKINLNSYARYSGLAFQMIIIIGIGVFGGIKLDEILNSSPLITAILSFVAVVLAIYLAIKDLLQKP